MKLSTGEPSIAYILEKDFEVIPRWVIGNAATTVT
jgi:hypothetical protein